MLESKRKPISLHRVAAQDRALGVVGQAADLRFELSYHLGPIFRMGIVRRPDDAVGTEKFGACRQVPFSGIETDVALPLEVFAGQQLEPAPLQTEGLDLLVHPLKLRRAPSAARL